MKFINIWTYCYKWYLFYVFWFCERGYEPSKNCSASYGTHSAQKLKQIPWNFFLNKQKTTFTNIKNYFSFLNKRTFFFVFFSSFFFIFFYLYINVFFLLSFFVGQLAYYFFLMLCFRKPCTQEVATNLSDTLRNRKTTQYFV